MAVRSVLERDRDPADRRGPGRQVLGARDQAAGRRHDAGAEEIRLHDLAQHRRQGFPASPSRRSSPRASTIRRASCRPTGIARPATMPACRCRPTSGPTIRRRRARRGRATWSMSCASSCPKPSKFVSITTYDPDDFIRIEVDKASVPAGCTLAKHPSLQGRVHPRLSGLCRHRDMPAAVKSAVLRSPFLWVGVLLLVALIGALVFSDGVAELARFSADYQRRIQQSLSTHCATSSPAPARWRCGPWSPSASATAWSTRWDRATARRWWWPTSSTAPGRAPGSRASSPAAGSPSPIRLRRCCWPAR